MTGCELSFRLLLTVSRSLSLSPVLSTTAMHHVARTMRLRSSLNVYPAPALKLPRIRVRPASTFGVDGIPMTLRTTEQPKPRTKHSDDESGRITSYIYFTTVFPIRIGILDLVRQQTSFENPSEPPLTITRYRCSGI